MTDKITSRGDYINGQFLVVDDPNGEIVNRNPSDLLQPPNTFPFMYEHIHEAVVSARRAFFTWRKLSHKERKAHLTKYRNAIEKHKAALARSFSAEIGLPLWDTQSEIAETLATIDYYLGLGDSVDDIEVKTTELGAKGRVRFVPRGVAAVVSPAVQSFLLPNSQLAPALLYGNTVVLKTSKFAPATGQLIMDIVHEANLPAGVFNILQGDAEVARRIVSHPDVDVVFFTGSFETGSKIRKQVLGDYGKISVLDTGGTNAAVIWNDCDYDRALKETFFAAYASAGQRAASTKRVLVHESLLQKFVDDFHTLAKNVSIGNPISEKENVFMGPLVSEETMENYLRAQGMAVREGCEEVMRGKVLEREKKGYFVSPSIHIVEALSTKSHYQTSEVLGPNVAVYKISSISEAAEIINLPRYGLVGSIYTAARENYMALSEEVNIGLLHWNGMTIHNTARLPYGGQKKSGNQRPMGSFAIQQCTYPLSSLEYEPSKSGVTFPASFPKR